MKKSILILMLLGLFSLVTYSQNETINASLGYQATYNLYTGITSDTIGKTDSTWSYVINKLTDEKLFAYAYIELDSLSGTADTVFFIWQYKMFDDEAFTNSDTTIYAGASESLTVVTTIATKADYWRLYVLGTDDDFKVGIDKFNSKFIK